MAKIRLTWTQTVEHEVDEEYLKENNLTLEEYLEEELIGAKDDPIMYFDNSDTKSKFKGKVII